MEIPSSLLHLATCIQVTAALLNVLWTKHHMMHSSVHMANSSVHVAARACGNLRGHVCGFATTEEYLTAAQPRHRQTNFLHKLSMLQITTARCASYSVHLTATHCAPHPPCTGGQTNTHCAALCSSSDGYPARTSVGWAASSCTTRASRTGRDHAKGQGHCMASTKS